MYAKFAAQLGATALSALSIALFGDNHISLNEGVNVALTFLGAVAVLGAGNLPVGVWKYTKSIVAAVTAALVILQSAISDGALSQTEWIQMVLAALGAIGVFAAKGPLVKSIGRHAAPEL